MSALWTTCDLPLAAASIRMWTLNLELIESVRFTAFVRALRVTWRPWLEELTRRVRKACKNLPENILRGNGDAFFTEDFADNGQCARVCVDPAHVAR